MAYLDHIALPGGPREQPLLLPWNAPSQPFALLEFWEPEEWRIFIESLDLHPAVPAIVSLKYYRAQKLYYLGWIDFDVIKAGELIALSALELALKDRYGNMKFDQLLVHMVKKDGLTDAKLRIVQKCGGGSVVCRLLGEVEPSLAQIRNQQAHGDPFDGMPQASLLEVVRDLIEYAYRGMTERY